MKKSLIALAVLAAAGTASAQSSVTLFGIVDAALSFGRGDVADRTRLVPNGNATSRLGFRGTEDLGGGMSASFWLEAQISPDDGSGAATNTNNQASGATTGAGLTFNRRATVSLAGGWGELRLGRDYIPAFWNLTVFDPFSTNGVGTNALWLQNGNGAGSFTGVTAGRASNSIGYFLPGKLGGFYGQAMVFLGENAKNGAATEDDGSGAGFRVGFATGPFNVALAMTRTEYAAGDVKQNNIGGEWNLGMAKLQAQYARDSVGNTDGKGWLIGGIVPVGAGEIKASYSTYETEAVGTDPQTKKLAVGYVHNLSKRTAVYTTYARLKTRGFATAATTPALGGASASLNGSSSGLDLGVRHSF